MKIKVGVIFGGESVEHEVSIISALQAIEHIDEYKYDIVPIYIGKDRVWYSGSSLLNIDTYRDLDNIKKMTKEVSLCKKDGEFCLVNTKGLINKVIDKIDIAFPIVHGQNVEDGTLAGYLDTVGIPYVGPKVLGASIGQDKVLIKQVLSSANVPVVDYVWFYDVEFLDNKDSILKDIKKLGYPVVVKPASLGSSVGINFVSSEKVIEDAINEAIEYDKKIIVEKAVENLVEVNCSVVGNYEIQEVSLIEQVVSDNSILTYEDKYVGNGKKCSKGGMANTSRIIPANIGKDLTKKIEETSIEVFRTLNLSGVCRIDYLINDKTKEFYVNEPNTIPGSLSFYLWKPKGKKYSELLDDMITLSIKEYKNKLKKTYCFDTNILKDFKLGKGVKK